MTRWLVVGGFVLGACSNNSASSGVSLPPPLDKAAMSSLPRAELVARADKLVAQSERAPRAEKAALLVEAGRMREWIWRIERRPPDAFEAIEQYTEAGNNGDCAARLRAGALKAELDASPGSAKLALADVSSLEPAAECDPKARALFGILGIPSPGSRPEGDRASEPARQELQPSQVVAPREGVTARGRGARITRVERYGAKDTARIVVGVSQPTTFRAGLLAPEPGSAGARLYVDIEHATMGDSESYVVGGLVQRVRLAGREDGVRLVLDLEEPAERRIFYMPEPFRLIVDVARGLQASKLRSSAPRVIERVVIDPGHGGHDPGAIGPRGLMEKDVTLDIAHRAAPLIAREVGLSTLLTRDNDTFVALDERTAKANAFRADLFISVHCNAAEHTGSDGVVTFVLDRTSDDTASRLAAIENATSQAAASELANSLGAVQDEGILARSLHFAGLLQRSTVSSLSKSYGTIPNQGVRRAGFYVLAGAHMPAVLFEVSFISNPDGESRLNTGDYRQRLADALVNAVRAYRDGL